MSKLLSMSDYMRAAHEIGCSVAAVVAVTQVESPKGGFLPSGKPTILFEAHKFGRFSGYRFNSSHPSISVRKWDKSLYLGGEREWERFNLAASLDRNAAMLSISMGRFQIMGFNFAAAGFPTVTEFFNAMHESEGKQLDAFVDFIRTAGLDDELRDCRWRDFAKKYNGESFAENRYDVKLKAAYEAALSAYPGQRIT